MRTNLFAAALLAPVVAFAPVSAMAHSCPRHHDHHHHHHGARASNGSYGSGKSMQNDNSGATSGQSSGAQDQNKSSKPSSGGTTY